MSRTGTQIKTRVGYELKDTGFTNYTEAEILEYINQAVRAVMQRIAATWPEYWIMNGEDYKDTDNLADGTPNYDLATDFYAMIKVVTTDSDGNDRIRKPVSLERSIDANADGYLLMNEDIYLYPTPDENVTTGLTMYYVSIPSDVAAIGNPVPLSDHFEDAIAHYVVLKCKARQEEKMADFASFNGMTQAALDMMVAKTNKSAADAGLRVSWRPMV